MLEIAADSHALLAVQFDADGARALLTTVAGETLADISRRHGRPMGRPDLVLDVVADVLRESLDECARLGRRVADLTVVAFAPVGGDPVVVIADTDLGWRTVDVLDELAARVPAMPRARLCSDSPMAMRAELRDLDDVRAVIYLKSDSGIGGALICDGRMITGMHGVAGALGHIAVDYDGLSCACGQRGCLVTVAGPDVMLARAGMGDEPARIGLNAALAEFSTRVRAGDEKAMTAWNAGVEWIVRALRILALSLDPGVIVLGGYWAGLAESVDKAWRDNPSQLVASPGFDIPTVVGGVYGADAALFGAIWSARERVLADPLSLAGDGAEAASTR